MGTTASGGAKKKPRRSPRCMSEGHDALATDGAGDGHRTDVGEGAADARAELIDDPVQARLDVEEVPIDRSRRIDGSAIGGGLTEQRQLTEWTFSVATHRGASRIRGVEVPSG